MHKRKPEMDRFFAKVEKTDSCWLWTGAKYRFGYGHFGRHLEKGWTMYKCHRYSYELFIGKIPKGMYVCHSCDVPNCVNPAHLWLGTNQDNLKDKYNKGRHVYGNNPEHHLLSMVIALSIRKDKQENPTITGKELAQKYKTSPAQISRILNNLIWKE